MKLTLLLRQLLPALLLTAPACTPQLAYQVLETRATPSASSPDLALAYNFWHEGGALTCTVQNLTNAPLYLDLNRSHLIVNGFSQDYYQDSETSNSTTVARSAYSLYSTASAQQASTSRFRPKPVLQVPPHAAVVVSGLSAVPARLAYCGDKWTNSKPATITYSEADSPLKFRQFLTYSAHPDGSEPRTLDNAFWVERVSNMSPGSFRGANVRDERCGKKLQTSHAAMPYAKTGNMYVTFRVAPTL